MKDNDQTLDKGEVNFSQLESELKRSQKMFTSLLDSLPAIVYVTDIKTNELLFINKYSRDIFGDVVGKLCWQSLQTGQTGPCDFCTNDKLLTPEGKLKGVYRWEFENTVNGRWYDIHDRAIEWTDGRIARLEIATDITERKKAEDAIRESEERLIEAQQIANIGHWEWDIINNTEIWSQETYNIFRVNRKNFTPTYDNFMNFIHPDDRESVAKAVEAGLEKDKPVNIDYRIRFPDGTERIVNSRGKVFRDKHGNPIRMTGTCQDITERKRLEEGMQKLAKLESIGVLAGGIAHDFNNISTAILNNLYIVKMLTTSDEKIQERLESIEKALMKAQSLTQQLLTFSKGGEPIKQLVNIRDVINESASLSLRGSNVHCESCMVDSLRHVEVDEGQMHQVFSNIIINADQSMSDGGSISVDCENVSVEAKTFLPLQKGDYVKVSIKDQGLGISEEHISKIFDPYFTTKEKGSGLGLTTAYSIIKRHCGHIEVESTEGLGTAFHIYLPASKEKAPDKKPSEAEPITGDGKILIMDDDELIRDSLGQILEVLGYSTGFAMDGNEAVEAYRNAMASGQPFDVVIMDLTIPGGAGGKETIGRLKTLDRNVKAIVSSGYSHDPIMAKYKNYGFKAVLNKPYKDIVELSVVINKVIKGS